MFFIDFSSNESIVDVRRAIALGLNPASCQGGIPSILQSQPAARGREEVMRQAIKWTVYSLLLLNWTYYMFDDWRAAQYTVLPGAPLTEWMQAFATTLDELAWFTLLFLFEAEDLLAFRRSHDAPEAIAVRCAQDRLLRVPGTHRICLCDEFRRTPGCDRRCGIRCLRSGRSGGLFSQESRVHDDLFGKLRYVVDSWAAFSRSKVPMSSPMPRDCPKRRFSQLSISRMQSCGLPWSSLSSWS